jgi:peptide chain release factor 2
MAMPSSPSDLSVPQRIAAIHSALGTLREGIDPDALLARSAELEAQMGEPGFWDDSDGAAKVSAEHARVTRKAEAFNAVVADAEDLEALREMAAEDSDMADELTEQLAGLESRIAAMEEERLFSGKYDSGDAIVTINSGAGGTDAQDLKVELLEASAGEEAGIKSAAFRAEGENAYGLFGAEKGVHRLVRISPFDSQARRQTAFAEVQVAPVIDDVGDVVIDMDDVGVDTYRASGAGGQHVNKTDSAVRLTHRPSGIVVQCQNERSQTANKEAALKVLRGKLVELRERERMEELAKERGESVDVGWGSQIRSYVLAPYTMVKDHRTNVEVGDPTRVLDGDLDGFVRAELLRRTGAGTGAADGEG